MMQDIISALLLRVGNDVGTLPEILAMLLGTFIFAFYEYLVYRIVSHRNIYNKAFHISIMVIPFFIAAIIMALQSNLVITLGTIGALAIIRFRTAVKDPVDMIYILWSIFVGISCGCQLIELCALTSITVTVVLVIINLVGTYGGKLFKNPYVLVVNCKENKEDELNEIIKSYSKNYRLKSRNYTSKGFDYIYQIQTNKATELVDTIHNLKYVEKFSLLEYDNEDVI